MTLFLVVHLVGCAASNAHKPSPPVQEDAQADDRHEEGYAISRSVRDGYTHLFVTLPGMAPAKVLSSPHAIPKYALSQDGRFIAYVSEERPGAGARLFIQQTDTGLRRSWAPVNDINGELRFEGSTLVFESPADKLVIEQNEIGQRFF